MKVFTYLLTVVGESLVTDFFPTHHVVRCSVSAVLQSVRVHNCLGNHRLRSSRLPRVGQVQEETAAFPQICG